MDNDNVSQNSDKIKTLARFGTSLSSNGYVGPKYSKPNYLKISTVKKSPNPFIIQKPKNAAIYTSNGKDCAFGGRKNIQFFNLNANWSRFCRGTLGPKSHLACGNCDNVICSQSEVDPHSFNWFKNQNFLKDRYIFLFYNQNIDAQLVLVKTTMMVV
jgi:hypothetical protein